MKQLLIILTIWVSILNLSCEEETPTPIIVNDSLVYVILYLDSLDSSQVDTVAVDTINTPVFEIFINGEEQEMNIYEVVFIDNGYRIKPEKNNYTTFVEMLQINIKLFNTGTYQYQKETPDQMIQGLLRVPNDTITGTTFNFLSDSLSYGTIQIDSIDIDSAAWGWMDYYVQHPLVDDSVYDIHIQLNGIPLKN